MGWATTDDLPAVAPLIDISTIFNIQDEPVPTPENVVVGLVTHLGLSAVFGIGFALIATRLGDLRRLVLGAVGFGVALYLVNFQILGRTAFPWFQEGPDQVFELFALGPRPIAAKAASRSATGGRSSGPRERKIH